MMYDSRSSPTRPANLPARIANLPARIARAPLLDLRPDPASCLAADRPDRLPDEYEDQWELNFLSHLAREMYEGDREEGPARQRYGQEEDGPRQEGRQAESRGKTRKKGTSKYKAYAVKMKVPSYHELKPRREGRGGETVDCKNRS